MGGGGGAEFRDGEEAVSGRKLGQSLDVKWESRVSKGPIAGVVCT